jgi:hypothetical protein
LRIAVVDGQGGGIGRLITEKLLEKIYRACPKDLEILALGTNALATEAMLGELTPLMAEAIAGSPARKIVLPLNRSNVELVGLRGEPLPHLVDEMISIVKSMLLQNPAKK